MCVEAEPLLAANTCLLQKRARVGYAGDSRPQYPPGTVCPRARTPCAIWHRTEEPALLLSGRLGWFADSTLVHLEKAYLPRRLSPALRSHAETIAGDIIPNQDSLQRLQCQGYRNKQHLGPWIHAALHARPCSCKQSPCCSVRLSRHLRPLSEEGRPPDGVDLPVGDSSWPSTSESRGGTGWAERLAPEASETSISVRPPSRGL